MDNERFVQPREIQWKEGRAERGMGLFRASSLSELGRVAFDSATQSLRLEDRKVRSQVVDVDLYQLPGKRTVRKVRRGGR